MILNVATISGQYGHINKGRPIIVGHLQGNRIEVVGAYESIAPIN